MKKNDESLGAIDVLVDFSRLLASAVDPGEVLSHLVAAASSRVGVRAGAIIATGGGSAARVAAVNGLPNSIIGLMGTTDEVDAELIRRLAEASGCSAARTYPLVSGGGLYGALVLLDQDDREPEPCEEKLAEAMTDLTAVALDKAFHEAELRRTLEELRESREALLRAERLKVLGEMAAVVTHEVRNPLAAMGGALQILEGRLASAPSERKIVQMVLGRLDGLNAMITELLTYARPKEPLFAAIDLAAIGREVIESAGADPSAAAIRFAVTGGSARCRGDRAQLAGVVLNLVINAVQAMKGEGEITLSVAHAGGWAELTVADGGPGVPEDLRTRIFEPFFTTRGGGTGLGLAIARGILERHRGYLELLSPPPGGARFRLRLPV